MSSLPGSEAARPALPGDRPAAEPPNPVCGYLEFFPPLHPSGGSQRVPHIVGSRELSGSFQYAAFHWRARVKSLTESCPPDTDYLPVPNGYTADWFGVWSLVCRSGCGGLTFEPAQLSGAIESSTWIEGTNYFLYVYTGETKQFLESYAIGPVTTDKRGKPVLNFASPFENRFVYPANDDVGLEIVHPTPVTHGPAL
jgi:hypothetical protein